MNIIETNEPGSGGPPLPLGSSYWPRDDSEPLVETTVGGLLRKAAAEVPDRIALVDGVGDPSTRRQWTYAEFLRSAEDLARALLDRFSPGERVAIWAPNCAQWAILHQGLSLAGLLLVGVNPAYRKQELEYVLRQSRAAGLFYADSYRGADLAGTVEEVRDDLPDLRETFSLSDLDAFSEQGDPAAELPDISPDDPVQIQYTSGTTGFPKGALLHHRGVVNSARFVALRADAGDGPVWINAMPLYHTGGSAVTVVGTLAMQGTHVVLPGFDPGLVLETTETHRGTISLLVPTMLIALMEHPDTASRDLSSLRTVLSGASSVAPELIRRTTETYGCEFSILFGQTEMNGVLTQTHTGDTPEDQSETIGRPLPQVEVKIADPDTGEIVPVGTPGEICARGYQTMDGYYDMPDATAEVLKDDGWLHSGDLGTMDERGYLKITGRLRDMIIRGGINVYPREIEELLFSHPAVADVAVLGLADETWGEEIAAVIRLADGGAATGDELRDYCREHLAKHKAPSMWFFVDEFPLTPSGKVQKFVLRDSIAHGKLTPVSSS